MPLQATSGAASYDAFGGGVPVVPVYIEDVMSTWLYTGNNTGQTITNGIDLSGKGGLVWIKCRNNPGYTATHALFDTARGAGKILQTSNTGEQFTESGSLTSFNSNGFSLGDDQASGLVNYGTTNSFASWTFRKQPKFFDVVTWTGTGVDGQVINHSLGVKPSVIIVKRTDTTSDWQYNDANDNYLLLNTTAASAGANRNGGWIPQYNTTATTLTTQNYSGNSNVNASGGTYVAYLFASNAGGFGLTGTDNVISCGSCSSDSSGYIQPVNLGYEPQWVMLKRTNSAANWVMMDTMRGMANTAAAASPILLANTSAAEAATGVQVNPTATGFEDTLWGGWGASNTYIYIAIRRGPMKVPTSGTSVFSQTLTSSNANPLTITTNFPVDMTINRYTGESSNYVFDRLRGANASASGTTATYLKTEATSAENTIGTIGDNMQSNTTLIDRSLLAGTSDPKIYYSFRRAPSFFDEVCYTGTGTTSTTFNHNLQTQPEMIIVKSRNAANNWSVAAKTTGTTYIWGLDLNTTAVAQSPYDYGANMSATLFDAYIGTAAETVNSGTTYVAYLFATCAGVSKVGSYTGNGSTQTIDCGFGAGGARFVLIKRTDSTGGWYVYDTARGMTVLTDPYLLLNDVAAQVATLGSVTTVSTGFALNATILAAINTNAASYIFLAIA